MTTVVDPRLRVTREKGRRCRSNRLAPPPAGFASYGSERRIGFFKKAHGVGKSVNQTSSKPRVFLFVPGGGFFQLLGSFLADFDDQN
ncbi:MAG TPA: hypothetical protein DIW43_02470 [Spongiibacteraceae bacterium]|nr:hypothetical protein [Spongiibacteraceae bacterium]